MMKAKMWMLALSVATASVAQAGEICDTIDSCSALDAKLQARLAVHLNNTAPSLSDIARNADGSVRRMTQYDAENYCRNQGERLPTVRELALYAQSLGAQGISETAKAGYYVVKELDGAGSPANFYFNSQGYVRPTGELGNLGSFWSSSVYPGVSDVAYGLIAGDGDIGAGRRSALDVVRCVQSR